MPAYEYYCESNGRRLTVHHPMRVELHTWGELCYITRESLGDTDAFVPVRRLVSAAYVHVPVGNTVLREKGFAKLVRRDRGVYENLTRLEGEARYMEVGKPATTPQLHKRIRD